jgi:ABC-2 type transport system ATP-binding protein
VQIVKSGQVTVLGAPAGAPQLRQTVRYVTQSPSVYGDLTVTENIRYFSRVYGIGAKEAQRAIDEVHLGPNTKQLVRDLSGGQRARVSLACAILGEPQILVLDEPTVGLDPVLREDIWATFHRKAATGTTLLVSSHVMDEASRCDRLLFIRDGHLIADGTPGNLLASTGQRDLEQAFLYLIKKAEAAA